MLSDLLSYAICAEEQVSGLRRKARAECNRSTSNGIVYVGLQS